MKHRFFSPGSKFYYNSTYFLRPCDHEEAQLGTTIMATITTKLKLLLSISHQQSRTVILSQVIFLFLISINQSNCCTLHQLGSSEIQMPRQNWPVKRFIWEKTCKG